VGSAPARHDCRAALIAAPVVLVLNGPLTAHDGPHDGPTTASFRVGRDGGINFREDVRLANTLVPKGKYRFGHRIDGDVHIITLTRIATRSWVDIAVYEVSTTLIAGRQPQKGSLLRAKEAADHSLHISVIEIAGEAADHLPRTQLGTR
jgi:hypothetical protein